MKSFTIICNMQVPNGTIWNINGEKTLFSEEIPIELKEYFCKTKKKGEKSENKTIFINHLRYFGLDIIQLLHILNFSESPEHAFKKMKSKTYSYLIGDNMCFYSIRIKYSKRYNVTIIDLDNLLSISNEKQIIDTWGTPGDYTIKSLGESYKKAVSDLFLLTGIKKNVPVTISGIARRFFFRERQKSYDCRNCTDFFNNAETFFRAAYHGGINSKGIGEAEVKIFKNGIVLDANSLYPYVMKKCLYPVGRPWKVKPENIKDTMNKAKQELVYFFIRVKTSFELKENGIPCVAMDKRDKDRWHHDKNFMIDSRNVSPTGERGRLQEITLTLTQTDFYLFIENYDIKSFEIIDCYAFQAKNIFKEYVDYWYNYKERHTGGKRRIAKIMLNSLSGSMARRVEYINGIVYFDERDLAFIKYGTIKSKSPKCYVHIGAAITSYARKFMIDKIRPVKDRWLYTDTDSIHLLGNDIPDFIRVSDQLGDFKIEKTFTEIIYYKLKNYGYKENGSYHLVLAGVERNNVEELEKYINHRTGTKDLWVTDDRADRKKSVKELMLSQQPLSDLFYSYLPMSIKTHKNWFDLSNELSYNNFGDPTKKKLHPVKIKTKFTTPGAEKEKDRIKEKRYKTPEPLPLDEWLKVMAKREKEGIQTKKENFEYNKRLKNGEFVPVREEIPFSD